MDWESLTRELEEVERHIGIGATRIARVRDELSRAIELGLDPVQGEHLLRALEATQEVYLRTRDDLQKARRLLAH
jgi:hypothetical protein